MLTASPYTGKITLCCIFLFHFPLSQESENKEASRDGDPNGKTLCKGSYCYSKLSHGPLMFPWGLSLTSFRVLVQKQWKMWSLPSGRIIWWFGQEDLHVWNHSKLARNEDKFVLSGLELTTAHIGVYGQGGGKRRMNPLGSVPEEVGMELGPEGCRRGRRKEWLYKVGRGMNKVAGGDSNSAGTQRRKTDWFFPRQWKNSPMGSVLWQRPFKDPILGSGPVLPFLLPPAQSRLSSSNFQILHPFFAGLLASNVLNSYSRYILISSQTLGKIQRGTLTLSQLQIFCPTVPICWSPPIAFASQFFT